MSCLVRLACDLQVRLGRLDRVQLGGAWQELADRQLVPGGDQLPHRAADVGSEVDPGHGFGLSAGPFPRTASGTRRCGCRLFIHIGQGYG
jgi:hypothetical protein